MKYKNILLPVQADVRKSMLFACIAQVLKLSIWLIMIWIVYRLSLNNQEFPLLPIISLFVVSVLFYTLKTYAHDKSHYAAFALEEILRTRLVKKINQLPLETINHLGGGNLVKVLIDDVKELHTFVADTPPLKAEAFVTPIVILSVLFMFNTVFASIVLCITLVTFILLTFIMKKGKLVKEQYNQATIQINTSIIEYVQGMSAVRIFDAGEGSYIKYKQALINYRDTVFQWLYSVRLSSKIARSLFSPMPMTILLITSLTVAYHYQFISLITLFSFLLLAVGIAESIHPVMSLFHLMEKSKAAIERIFEIEELASLSTPETPKSPKNWDITFDAVSFGYQGKSNSLNNINLHMLENSFNVIVGPSGSGKTTMVNLIPRFLEASQGSIRFGGVDLKDIPYDELMSNISFVFQNNFLFSCSIADNIRYGLDNISDQAVVEAAKKAEIHDFIMTLPQQYDTPVGERGQLLSGGQKQRITIARTFLQDRPIIILDEPTAFSDARNEALLLKAFMRLIEQNKTVILITHRLPIAMKADQIIILDKGSIKANGTHEQLIKESVYYQELWKQYRKAKEWVLSTQ